MKKLGRILGLVIVLCCIITITGCSNAGNSLVKQLNDDITKMSEKMHPAKTGVYADYLNGSFESDSNPYTIVAAGSDKFTSSYGGLTEYKQYPDGYTGKTISKTTTLDENSGVNYILVYDKSSKKYFNISVKYKDVKIDGVSYTDNIPVFSNAVEVK